MSGEGSRPVLKMDPAIPNGLIIIGSTGIVIDGIVFDATDNPTSSYIAVVINETSATVKNSAVIGPDASQTTSVSIYGGMGAPKTVAFSIPISRGTPTAGSMSPGVSS